MRALAVSLAPPSVSDRASRAARVVALSAMLCPSVGTLAGAAVYVGIAALADGTLAWLTAYGEVALFAFVAVWRLGLAAGLVAGLLAVALGLAGGRGRTRRQWCALGTAAGASLGAGAPLTLGAAASGDPAVLGVYLAAGVVSGAVSGALVGAYAWRELGRRSPG